MWKIPSPVSVATSRLIDKFNEVVQTDLMFVSPNAARAPQSKHHTHEDPEAQPWQHNLCACTRLSAAIILECKTALALINALDTSWIRPYGPMTTLETDQEGAWNSDEARVYLTRQNIKLVLKGKDAHAKMLEIHNKILRITFLKTKSQALQEGLRTTHDLLLTTALTAKNSLFTIGNTTPMVAVFGRQTPALPNLELLGSHADDTHTGPDGHSRGRHRLKEIATQSMTEATAITRMQIASRSKTRAPVEAKELNPGDEVEFHRSSGSKDVQGWRGPAEVLKISRDGTVDIKFQGSPLTCRNQDIRTALYLFLLQYIFLVDDTRTSKTTPLQLITHYVERLAQGTTQTLSLVHMGTGHTLSQHAKSNPQLYHALLHTASCLFHLSGCIGARIAHGIVRLKPISHIHNTFIWHWPQYRPKAAGYLRTPNNEAIETRQLHTKHNIDDLCIVQFLMVHEDEVQSLQQQFSHIPHLGQASHPMDTTMHPSLTPLIPSTLDPALDHDMREDRNRPRTGSDADLHPDEPPHKSQCLPHEDDVTSPQDIPVPDDHDLDDIPMLVETITEEPTDQSTEQFTELPCYHVTAPQQYIHPDNSTSDTMDEVYVTATDPDADNDPMEIYMSRDLAHWSTNCPRELDIDEVLVFTITKTKATVTIRRDLNNLSKDEIEKHWPLVEKAMMDELKRWHDLKTFERMSISKATNTIDGTWVLKWKRVKTTDKHGKTTETKIIKARLTARGFKDLQAYENDISTYSGTSSKTAQRIVNGHAAQNGYTIWSMDISAAFLKGMTFKEIARLTGEPIRCVQFRLPKNCIHLLQRLPSLKDLNPLMEVLNFLVAMWGLKDAPRAFGLRRDQVLREFGARPTVLESHLWVKTTKPPNARSTVAMSTHIDDIKGSSDDTERETLATLLRKHFGDDLKVNITKFEFTGIQHAQHDDKSITNHQDHYVLELSVIPLDPNNTEPDTADATEHETDNFNSLLGGLAWLLMTRADISAWIGFLQRLGRKPKRVHLKMINKVLRYCKRNSAIINYKRLPGKPYILLIADSAYTTNDDSTDCIALRGYFVFLACAIPGKPFPASHLQLLNFVSRKLHTISRSAFAAELRNLHDAFQEAINCAVLFHDIYRGPLTAPQSVTVRDNATYFLEIHAVTDNFGLYSAITKDEPSAGSDASMIMHVKAARHYLDNGNLTSLTWCDNRDMLADGLTKGKPPRNIINDALDNCTWVPAHTCTTWQPRKPDST